jgi:hypothetical protein
LPSRARIALRRLARRAPIAAALAAALGLLAGGAALAAPPDPSANIPLGPLPQACRSAPRGAVCENAAIAALDSARARLGLGRYRLPSGFIALAPARQWLVLANLDRLAYSLRPIPGLSQRLDTVAREGAAAGRDPDPYPLLLALHGAGSYGFTSNWAGGQANGLYAYYGWMYDDGYGGPNVDCSTPTAAGCWGHRRDILAFGSGGVLTMGAAVVRSHSSYALTIVNTPTAVWPYGYTWAQVDLPAKVKWPPSGTNKGGVRTSNAVSVESRARRR